MSRPLGAGRVLDARRRATEDTRWRSTFSGLYRSRSRNSTEGGGGSVRTTGDTRLVFSWDVQPGEFDPSKQRLIFSWDVLEPAGPQTSRLKFFWDVAAPAKRLIFFWDVVPSELFDAASGDVQLPISHVDLTPSREFKPKSFTVSSNLARPADMFTCDATGLGAYRGRSQNDRITLEVGLTDPTTRERVLWPVITRGIPIDYYANFSAKGIKVSGQIRGRDQMVKLQDGTYSMIYYNGAAPTIIAGTLTVPIRTGEFMASDIAKDIAAFCGLKAACQFPDYKINDKFIAVGRPLDLLLNLVKPFSLVEARKVDVFTIGDTVYLRQRQLSPTASDGLTFSAHDLRLSNLTLRAFQTNRIGRVTLRGRLTVGGRPGGVTTTPPGGVPIPHDTELHPIGGGSPVVIYSSLPPDAEAVLLQATGQAFPVGTVQQPDGSTLGVGTVVFTAERFAQDDSGEAWVIPSGSIVQPDGTIRITSGTPLTVPTAWRVVINSDSTATVLHP